MIVINFTSQQKCNHTETLDFKYTTAIRTITIELQNTQALQFLSSGSYCSYVSRVHCDSCVYI